MYQLFIELMERGFFPDWLIRLGVRRLCRERLASLAQSIGNNHHIAQSAYAAELANTSLAQATQEANRQHYEVPTEFYLSVLGSARKYSCTYFESPEVSLDQAEKHALEITMERAELTDGMNILELGCGWGSLTLEMARTFPNARILAVSNSATQKQYIEARARQEGLAHVEVKTLDLSLEKNILEIPAGGFDRVVSVEMFEHFKNYRKLLSQVSYWLKSEGKLFVHIFTHQKYFYPFETEGSDNWMGRYFFTGGQMPSRDLLKEFQENLRLEHQWNWNGAHYQKTAEAWLRNLDSKRQQVLKIFEGTYGKAESKRWLERWRVFFISCSELFGYNDGAEWGVSHYLFSQKNGGAAK